MVWKTGQNTKKRNFEVFNLMLGYLSFSSIFFPLLLGQRILKIAQVVSE